MKYEINGSHPSRVRGLKQIHFPHHLHLDQSHPSRVRGLKHMAQAAQTGLGVVAPFTGAWIETLGSVPM